MGLQSEVSKHKNKIESLEQASGHKLIRFETSLGKNINSYLLRAQEKQHALDNTLFSSGRMCYDFDLDQFSHQLPTTIIHSAEEVIAPQVSLMMMQVHET